MSQTVTQKKLDANRRNAQQSTGPKTPEGKARASRNALKHGLLARSIIVANPQAGETQEKFDELLADLIDQYQPQSTSEDMMVESLADAWWRKCRARRFEAAVIARNFDAAPVAVLDADLPPELTAELAAARADLDREIRSERDFSMIGLDQLDTVTTFMTHRHLFDELARTCQVARFIAPGERPLQQLIGEVHAGTLERDFFKADAMARKEFLDALAARGIAGRRLHDCLLDIQRELVGRCRERVEACEAEVESARSGLASQLPGQGADPALQIVPADKDLPRLQRYESMIDRQLHRAFAELRRMQNDRLRAQGRTGRDARVADQVHRVSKAPNEAIQAELAADMATTLAPTQPGDANPAAAADLEREQFEAPNGPKKPAEKPAKSGFSYSIYDREEGWIHYPSPP